MPDLSPEHERLIETVTRAVGGHVPALDALALKLARLEQLERGAADFLAVAERMRSGDPSLSPEAWYAERDYMRVLLAAREEEPESVKQRLRQADDDLAAGRVKPLDRYIAERREEDPA